MTTNLNSSLFCFNVLISIILGVIFSLLLGFLYSQRMAADEVKALRAQLGEEGSTAPLLRTANSTIENKGQFQKDQLL